MTATSKATEPTDHHNDLNELRTDSSPHVIEFFTARDEMDADSSCATDPFGYKHDLEQMHFMREHSRLLSDPLEDWLYSLISGAALVSLLIGILCLPGFTGAKTGDAKPQPNSHAESSFVTQKPG